MPRISVFYDITIWMYWLTTLLAADKETHGH